MLKKIFLMILALSLFAILSGCATKIRKLERSEMLMHTVFRFVIYTGLSDEAAEKNTRVENERAGRR